MFSLIAPNQRSSIRASTASTLFATRRQIGSEIRPFVRDLKDVSDSELCRRSNELRELASRGVSILHQSILVPGMGLIVESIRRQLGHEIFDIQIDAAIALARGCIVEMQTGEGKTLSAGLTAYLHALRGRGVHVATSNAYLAQRDRSQLAPAFERLGVTCGFISDKSSPFEKRSAYECDITYGAGYEFGFDYLRDQLKLRRLSQSKLGQKCILNSDDDVDQTSTAVQRSLWLAIVDEADNVLLDDACSPLVLSESESSVSLDEEVHRFAGSVAGEMIVDREFHLDPSSGGITFTSCGLEELDRRLKDVPTRQLRRPWSDYVEQAVRARWLFRRDVHYVIVDGEVRIVDGTTGRVFEDRKWSDGLHQAIEAKEGLVITSETCSMARITRQRFYGLYRNLAGLTGTATGSEGEFAEIYRTRVVPLPLRVPSQRRIYPPRFFINATAKAEAIVAEILDVHRARRPVLVGTRTIAESEDLSSRLASRGVPHQVLNGRQSAEEAGIVAGAGAFDAVTISTNIAGRGTDIKPCADAISNGGLHVIACGRHESSRIDRQLIGRGARQGNPGTARVFCAADDWLVQTHAPWIAASFSRYADRTGEIKLDFSAAFDRAQRNLERQHVQVRRTLFRSDQRRDAVMAKIDGQPAIV